MRGLALTTLTVRCTFTDIYRFYLQTMQRRKNYTRSIYVLLLSFRALLNVFVLKRLLLDSLFNIKSNRGVNLLCTVKPLFKGHPRDQGKGPLNRGVLSIEITNITCVHFPGPNYVSPGWRCHLNRVPQRRDHSTLNFFEETR